MADTIKITDSEIMEVKLLQEKFQQKIFELGRLYLQKLQIESTAKNIVLVRQNGLTRVGILSDIVGDNLIGVI